MSCRTGCCRKMLWMVALLAVAFLATAAFAQPGITTENCIQNEWNLAQGKSVTCTSSSCSLGCTANDVSIAAVENTRDVTGAQVAQCQGGNTFNFIADFEIKTTSKSSRSNIGLYIAETGTTVADALSVTNTCADNIIPPPTGFVNNNTDGKHPTTGANGHFLCSGSSTVLCGTDYYDELDQAGTTKPADNCGDTSSTDKGGFGTSTQKVTLEIDGFKCPDPNDPNLPTCTVNINGVPVTGKCAVLPNCTSWQVPGQTTFCESTPGQQGYPYNNHIPEAVPGTSSKCNCGVITLPIIAQKGNVVVQKMCQTPITNGSFTFDPGNPSAIPPTSPTESPTSCDSGVEGSDTVTYEVAVTNQSNFGSLSLTTLNDDVYGDITKVQGGVLTTNCAVPQTIALNKSYTCTFTAKNAGTSTADAPTITDIVSATLTDQSNKTIGPTTSNSVTVTPDEAPSAATVNKGLGSPALTAGCATANFKIDVKNTTNPGYDEAETLTGLSDNVYKDVTAIAGSTCSVPQTITPGNTYSCQFSGQFCGNLQTVDQLGTGQCNTGTGICAAGQLKGGLAVCAKDADCNLTCLGLTQTDIITATMQGDEASGTPLAGDPITPTGNNQLTVDVCLSATAQASH